MLCSQSLLGIEAFDVPYGTHTFVAISINICCEICFKLPPSDSGPMILTVGAWGLRILVAEVFVRSAALGISLQ